MSVGKNHTRKSSNSLPERTSLAYYDRSQNLENVIVSKSNSESSSLSSEKEIRPLFIIQGFTNKCGRVKKQSYFRQREIDSFFIPSTVSGPDNKCKYFVIKDPRVLLISISVTNIRKLIQYSNHSPGGRIDKCHRISRIHEEKTLCDRSTTIDTIYNRECVETSATELSCMKERKCLCGSGDRCSNLLNYTMRTKIAEDCSNASVTHWLTNNDHRNNAPELYFQSHEPPPLSSIVASPVEQLAWVCPASSLNAVESKVLLNMDTGEIEPLECQLPFQEQQQREDFPTMANRDDGDDEKTLSDVLVNIPLASPFTWEDLSDVLDNDDHNTARDPVSIAHYSSVNNKNNNNSSNGRSSDVDGVDARMRQFETFVADATGEHPGNIKLTLQRLADLLFHFLKDVSGEESNRFLTNKPLWGSNNVSASDWSPTVKTTEAKEQVTSMILPKKKLCPDNSTRIIPSSMIVNYSVAENDKLNVYSFRDEDDGTDNDTGKPVYARAGTSTSTIKTSFTKSADSDLDFIDRENTCICFFDDIVAHKVDCFCKHLLTQNKLRMNTRQRRYVQKLPFEKRMDIIVRSLEDYDFLPKQSRTLLAIIRQLRARARGIAYHQGKERLRRKNFHECNVKMRYVLRDCFRDKEVLLKSYMKNKEVLEHALKANAKHTIYTETATKDAKKLLPHRVKPIVSNSFSTLLKTTSSTLGNNGRKNLPRNIKTISTASITTTSGTLPSFSSAFSTLRTTRRKCAIAAVAAVAETLR